jgi:hypothetical protein
MIINAWNPGSRGIWRAVMWGVLGALLLAPVVATQFTDDVRWTGFDVAAAAVLLGGLGLSVELTVRVVTRERARATIIGACLLTVLLIWAHGAVGVF